MILNFSFILNISTTINGGYIQDLTYHCLLAEYSCLLVLLDGWLVVLGLTALWDNISVYIGPPPKEREKEKRKDRWEKNVQTTPPAHTASAVGPCPTVITIVGRPGTGSLASSFAPPDQPPVL